MKRFVLASVAALALTLACQQQASAIGFSYSGSIGINVSADFNWWRCCPPPACNGGCASGYDYGYAAPAYAAPSYYPSYAGTYAPNANYGTAQQVQSAPLPQGPAIAAQPGVQQTGYYYYGNYGNYGYYQAPSYWYGR